jgi:hypothetical protein
LCTSVGIVESLGTGLHSISDRSNSEGTSFTIAACFSTIQKNLQASWGISTATTQKRGTKHQSNRSLLFDYVATGLDEIESEWIDFKQASVRELRQERRKEAAEAKIASTHHTLNSASSAQRLSSLGSATNPYHCNFRSHMDPNACPSLILFTMEFLQYYEEYRVQYSAASTHLVQLVVHHVLAFGAGNGAHTELPFLVDPFVFGYAPDGDLLAAVARFSGDSVREVDGLIPTRADQGFWLTCSSEVSPRKVESIFIE